MRSQKPYKMELFPITNKISIYDVAREANVSSATVSRVIKQLKMWLQAKPAAGLRKQ
jgi:transcriptional antiterminator